MIFAPWKVKAIGALALVAILAGTSAGWWFTKTAYERDISDLKGEQAREREGWLKERLAITAKAKLDTDAAIARMKDAQGELARIDAENQRRLADAEQEKLYEISQNERNYTELDIVFEVQKAASHAAGCLTPFVGELVTGPNTGVSD